MMAEGWQNEAGIPQIFNKISPSYPESSMPSWDDYSSELLLFWDHTLPFFSLFQPLSYDILSQNSQTQKLNKFSLCDKTHYHDYILKLPLHLKNLGNFFTYWWTALPIGETSVSTCWPGLKTYIGNIVSCHVVWF